MTSHDVDWRKFTAEELLKYLGVTDPAEIDIEAIACFCKAEVQYAPLFGSEATITGIKNNAVITIDESSRWRRKRFSIGHELGHWRTDKGKVSKLCKKEYIGSTDKKSKVPLPEISANSYASKILMPEYLFKPVANELPINFETIKYLSDKFETSKLATSIRLIDMDTYPSMLIYTEGNKRKRFSPSKSVPYKFFPHEILQKQTLAYDIFTNKKSEAGPSFVNAGRWIDIPYANQYEIKEHSVRYYKNQILTLLWWEDESQILDWGKYNEY